jgi:hypothetical protein
LRKKKKKKKKLSGTVLTKKNMIILGFAGYYRKFVRTFTEITTPNGTPEKDSKIEMRGRGKGPLHCIKQRV